MIKKSNSSCIKQPLLLSEHSSEYLGSSETTREASFFDFSDYQTHGKPNHIKSEQLGPLSLSSDQRTKTNQTYYDFLIWFIGFSEGDGSFFFTKNCLFFYINQKEAQVLYQIRTKLGFGVTRNYTQDNKSYYRFSVSNKKNILRLIHLFNGNIVLDKVQRRFEQWVAKANSLWKLNISVKQTKPEISLTNSWLAGFIQAEGGFYARVRKNSKMTTGYKLEMKFYITQKGELEALKFIKDLLKSKGSVRPTKVQQFSQKPASSFSELKGFQNVDLTEPDYVSYNRIEICSFLSHAILIDYLGRYPCKGEKNIVLSRWKKIYWRREKGEHLTDSGILKLRQLCGKVIESQKKIEDIVHRLETFPSCSTE